LRDSIAFAECTRSKSSDSISAFLLKYPESYLYNSALKTYDDFEYQEITPQKTIPQLQYFISRYKKQSYH